jgi:hypothetical protein
VQDRRFGVLAPTMEMLDWAVFLRGWTFAAGDLLTHQQGAILAAASGTLAAAALNHALTVELAENRLLP